MLASSESIFILEIKIKWQMIDEQKNKSLNLN